MFSGEQVCSVPGNNLSPKGSTSPGIPRVTLRGVIGVVPTPVTPWSVIGIPRHLVNAHHSGSLPYKDKSQLSKFIGVDRSPMTGGRTCLVRRPVPAPYPKSGVTPRPYLQPGDRSTSSRGGGSRVLSSDDTNETVRGDEGQLSTVSTSLYVE